MKNVGRISIKEVAKLAGVSPTTVSRVINNSDHPVNPQTKKLVQETVKKYNFQPNRLAQGLVKNKSHIIGVIVHDIADEYFSQMVKGIESVTSDYHYIVNICNTDRNIEKELRAVNILKAHRADAIIFISASFLDDYYRDIMAKHIEDLKSQGSVVIGITPRPFAIHNIEIGHQKAAKMITDYVLEMGHRDIIYASGPKVLNTALLRLAGFKESLCKKGVELRESNIFYGDFSLQSGRKVVLDNLDQLQKSSAIVASTDVIALGVLWELKHQGIKVPEEMSVVGIGNIPATEYADPPLTTVSLPVFQIGVKIGQRLINCLEHGAQFSEEMDAEIKLMIRDSVKRIC